MGNGGFRLFSNQLQPICHKRKNPWASEKLPRVVRKTLRNKLKGLFLRKEQGGRQWKDLSDDFSSMVDNNHCSHSAG
ncbi:MAG: hypothetical protein A2V86_15480 [Deltaproteobacteria bacterium RBG_16_49_23]|nr:MAG: hypothetical protein A2V86_15480 [Deltaproteobacteria bacterium RBG_16_49_23]